jgi:hypothetical protein
MTACPQSRIALVIQYVGTNFHGWQRQPHHRSVQEEIEKALADILGHAVTLHGAGRTDSGVHAAAQVAHFFVSCEGGEMDILKLVKLIYLSDRASLQSRRTPIVGGAFYSLKHGPVTEEVLDLINEHGAKLLGIEYANGETPAYQGRLNAKPEDLARPRSSIARWRLITMPS